MKMMNVQKKSQDILSTPIHITLEQQRQQNHREKKFLPY